MRTSQSGKFQGVGIVDSLKNSTGFLFLRQPIILVDLDLVLVVDRENLAALEVDLERLDNFSTNVRHSP